MKKSLIAAVTLAILLIVSAVAFAIHSSTNRTLSQPAMAPPELCSTPVQQTCSFYDEYDFPSIPAHSSVDLTLTVSGADAGDDVIVTPVITPETGLLWGGSSSLNTVKIRLVNVTGSAIDPVERKYRITVNRY